MLDSDIIYALFQRDFITISACFANNYHMIHLRFKFHNSKVEFFKDYSYNSPSIQARCTFNFRVISFGFLLTFQVIFAQITKNFERETQLKNLIL